MHSIQIGDRVKCNRDLPKREIVKGEEGEVIGIQSIDSEDYFDVKLVSDGAVIFTSSENCWDKVEKS